MSLQVSSLAARQDRPCAKVARSVAVCVPVLGMDAESLHNVSNQA